MTKNIILLLFIVASIPSFHHAQYQWLPISNAPATTNKHDDVFFISEHLGWLVTRDGKIIKTSNGGTSWSEQAVFAGVRLRCVSFADSLRGWVGKFQVNPSTQFALLSTTDGGTSWTEVKNIPAPVPSGMCALQASYDPVIFGCGRYAGPPIFIKSTDGGTTWISKDLSAVASMLIDLHFFNPDTGIIAAAYGNKAAILLTTNGGETWNRTFTSTHEDEWSWKISFPDRYNGFVSLQTFQDSVFYLKTTDGGISWSEKFFLKSGGTYSPQGIGFITPSIGWIGAYPSFGTGRSEATYKTTNGGKTWAIDPTSKNINRFRWLNDSLGFAAGNTVYKYSKSVTGVIDRPRNSVSFRLDQNFPNPFNPKTTIRFHLSSVSFVTLTVHDVLGREVSVLLRDDELQAGMYSIPFEGTEHAGGLYYYSLKAGNQIQTRSMVMIK